MLTIEHITGEALRPEIRKKRGLAGGAVGNAFAHPSTACAWMGSRPLRALSPASRIRLAPNRVPGAGKGIIFCGKPFFFPSDFLPSIAARLMSAPAPVPPRHFPSTRPPARRRSCRPVQGPVREQGKSWSVFWDCTSRRRTEWSICRTRWPVTLLMTNNAGDVIIPNVNRLRPQRLFPGALAALPRIPRADQSPPEVESDGDAAGLQAQGSSRRLFPTPLSSPRPARPFQTW
jgi:hypothetical protein